jgi:hypothetical protein
VEVALAFRKAGCNPAERFELAEAALDPVALLVPRLLVAARRFPVGFGREDRDGSGRFDGLHQGLGIVAFIG